MKQSKSYINEFKEGDPVDHIFLVASKELKKTKQNKPYLNLELADKTGSINAKIWEDNNAFESESTFTKDDFIHIKGSVQTYKNIIQLKINGIKKINRDKVDLSDFTQQTKQDIELLWSQLTETLETIKNPYLSKLVSSFLKDKDFVKIFKHSPASIKHHQNYIGGLLEHTVKILNMAQNLLTSYSSLNQDLLFTGIFFHDVGKIKEYECQIRPEHTDEGRLVGHTVLGILMVEEKIKQIKNFPYDLLMHLRHLMVSHHGERMYGAPVVPMTAEALALHYLDNIDARLSEYYEVTDQLPDDKQWTNWLGSMERRFYNPK